MLPVRVILSTPKLMGFINTYAFGLSLGHIETEHLITMAIEAIISHIKYSTCGLEYLYDMWLINDEECFGLAHLLDTLSHNSYLGMGELYTLACQSGELEIYSVDSYKIILNYSE